MQVIIFSSNESYLPHQRQDWKSDKKICSERGFRGYPVRHIIPVLPPSNFLTKFRHKSEEFVADGKLKASKSFLFAWGVTTCALLIVWGKSSVIMLHLSGWNEEGSPFGNECIDLTSKMDSKFHVVRAAILPGALVNKDLGFGIMYVLRDLMENKVLKNVPKLTNVEIFQGLQSSHVICASLPDKLEVFINPILSSSDSKCPVS